MNAQGGADALGAVREAIRMYMGMRDDRMERDRQALSDERADRVLNMQEEAAKEDMRQGERRSMEYLITNFGGQLAAPAEVERGQKLGYGSAFEPEMTLPSRNMGQADIPSPMQTISQYTASQPTGQMRFKMPETEKSRVAYYNAATRASEGNANRQTRLEVANIGQTGANKRAELAAALGRARIELSRYATDVASRDRISRMIQQAEQFSTLLDDRNIDNAIARYRALGPLALIQGLQGDGPALNVPQIQPPGGGSPAGFGGGSDWEMIP